jgi:hypothetical protein
MPEHYIVCAAVKTKDGIVHVGKRHSDCFTLIGTLWGIAYHFESTQGFVDNYWKFHIRSEAWKIAKAAWQLKREWERTILYSEDIY